eukprot:NODE_153_length_3504_cov_10.813444.p1 GENE.NODE_153_length_3504_cov_10.813444~~NODE_153_length_3504_cov_10.813444.p1  ORF type:complete len:911 (-),score=288.87 NODE_153_length_3504_cov_10.813444:627-3359(-)
MRRPMIAAVGAEAMTSNDIFDEIDTNHDGVITRSEFNRVLAKSPVASATVTPVPALYVQQVRTSATLDGSMRNQGTTRYQAMLSSEDMRRIVEKHDSAGTIRSTMTDQVAQMEAERKMHETIRNYEVKNQVHSTVQSHLESDRAEWNQALQTYHSQQMEQFEGIIGNKVSEAIHMISALTTSCEARFEALEADRVMRQRMLEQLRTVMEGQQADLVNIQNHYLTWRAQYEQSAGQMSNSLHETLAALGNDLEGLRCQHQGHVDHQTGRFESLTDQQAAMHTRIDETFECKHSEILRSIEEQRQQQQQDHLKLEAALQFFARAEDQAGLEGRLTQCATTVDLQELDRRIQENHDNLELAVRGCARAEDQEGLAGRLTQFATIQEVQKLEQRLQEAVETQLTQFAPVTDHANTREMLAGVDARLSVLQDTQEDRHSEACEKLAQLQNIICETCGEHSAKLDEKLEKRLSEHTECYSTKHAELQESHAELVERHMALATVHQDLHDENCSSHKAHHEGRCQLEELFERERNARETSHQAAGVQFNDLHKELLRLQEAAAADRAAAEARRQDLAPGVEAKFAELSHVLENHEAQLLGLERLTADNHTAFESRMAVFEPRFDTLEFRMGTFRDEVGDNLAQLRKHMDEIEGSATRAIRAAQEQFQIDLEHRIQPLKTQLTEETQTRVQNITELQNRLATDLEQLNDLVDAHRTDLVRELQDAHGVLDRSLTDRHLAHTTAHSQQLTDTINSVRAEHERQIRDMHERVEESCACVLADRTNQLKTLEESIKEQCFFVVRDKCAEDRIVLRKAHEEQLRCLEVERDARLRQATELRADMVKAITKEREERIVDNAEQRTEITKVMREWHFVTGVPASSYMANAVAVPSLGSERTSLLSMLSTTTSTPRSRIFSSSLS